MRDLVLLGLGITVGAGMGSAHTGTVSEPVAVDVSDAPESASDLPIDCAARERVLTAERERLDLRLRTARIRRTLLEARRRLWEGVPQGWPDDVDDRFRPEAVIAAMSRVADTASGVKLVGHDCDEFPCLAAFERPEVGPTSAPGADRESDPLLAALRAHGYEEAWAGPTIGVIHTLRGTQTRVLAVGRPGTDEGVHRRDLRMRRMAEQAARGTLRGRER